MMTSRVWSREFCWVAAFGLSALPILVSCSDDAEPEAGTGGSVAGMGGLGMGASGAGVGRVLQRAAVAAPAAAQCPGWGARAATAAVAPVERVERVEQAATSPTTRAPMRARRRSA